MKRRVYPGAYYRLKVPAISWLEWHPFSLAGNVTSDKLTFFIADVGDWTHVLIGLLKNQEKRNMSHVWVQGPFEAPAKSAHISESEKPSLLIASGVGITPLL